MVQYYCIVFNALSNYLMAGGIVCSTIQYNCTGSLHCGVSRARLDGQDKPNQPCTARIVSSATSEFAQGVIWKEVKQLTRRRNFFEISVLFESELGVLIEMLEQVLKDIHYHSAMR
jgi:hypothetical protein